MIKNRTITINEREFFKKLSEATKPFVHDTESSLAFAIFCSKIHKAIFDETNYVDDTDTDTPFKAGDEVFVIGNEGDDNTFVNQVVTVLKIENDDTCNVTNGDGEQWIYFKNLRKVLN